MANPRTLALALPSPAPFQPGSFGRPWFTPPAEMVRLRGVPINRGAADRPHTTNAGLVCLIVFGDNGMQARGDFIARTVFIVLCLFIPGQINDAVAIALHS